MSFGIVRRLPRPIRVHAIEAADAVRAFLERRTAGSTTDPIALRLLRTLPRRARRRYTGTRVAVVGLFSTPCGLQRGAELMVRDLLARGIQVLAFDLAPALGMAPELDTTATADPAVLLAWAPTDIVIHINPPIFARVLTLLPPQVVLGCGVVGFWVWELSVMPPSWKDCADYVDQVWAPSPFVAAVIAAGLADAALAGGDLPVRVVPHAADRDPMAPTGKAERTALRTAFGLPEASFVVGTSFSFSSNYTRKNPCGSIDAFRAAFRGGERACLVIRCNDALRHALLYEHLVSYAGDDPRIHIWECSQRAYPIRQFYGQLDAYISLHRSEGYGLNLVEAAQTGIPVIATGWALSPDIVARPQVRQVAWRLVVPIDTQKTYEQYAGARWAEPDICDAADALRATHARWTTETATSEGNRVEARYNGFGPLRDRS